MKAGFGGVIVYVPDAEAAAAFYERAFGFVQEDYAQKSLPEFVRNQSGARPAGFEILVVNKDVDAAFKRAVDAGATPVAQPHDMPWGQRVSYVRDLNGVLVEICAPWTVP